jgi:hypothetical protein
MTDTTSQESGDWHAAGPGPAATSQSRASQEARATLTDLIRRSFLASVGSIVFGMEDGTVSMFGLVFGVAASAPDSRAVLLAGGTGAVAAAASIAVARRVRSAGSLTMSCVSWVWFRAVGEGRVPVSVRGPDRGGRGAHLARKQAEQGMSQGPFGLITGGR